MEFDRSTQPHRRFNPLLGEWVLVSPHRTERPWQGQEERAHREIRPDHDPSCYLCPGTSRSSGATNPLYEETFWFENDFPALTSGDVAEGTPGMFAEQPATGECRVLCFSPAHNLTLATLSPRHIERVVRMWQEQVRELGSRNAWVQVFENHGEAMGASNPHPHGQVWATGYLPTIPAREDACQAAYLTDNGRPLLVDYLERELELRERVVVEGEHWAWLVPHWAVWPFETLLLPKRHVEWLPGLEANEVADLARVLKAGLVGYDRLFGVDFPYSMGWHGLPSAVEGGHWQLHAHFYPPLLRSATVRKFMVGFEMLGEAQRDLTPEQAATRLRGSTPSAAQV